MVATKSRQRSTAPGDPARRRLIEAGMKIFAERGFDGTTTRDIASEVGLSPASLYVHFRSKEQLLYVISLGGHQFVDGLVREALEVSDDPAEQMGALAEGVVAGHLDRHDVARVINNEVERLGPDHQDEILRMRGEVTSRIADTIERGIAAGIFDPVDVPVTAVAITSLISDCCRWYRTDDADEVAHIAAQYRRLVLGMLGHREDRSGRGTGLRRAG